MDWSSGTLLNKSKLYCERAHREMINSALFAFWMSLALELLARSALSKLHPVLLADPLTEDNIHFAFGVNPKKNPRSVHAKTVFARCSVLIPDFTDQMAGFCLILANRRNEELHTGLAAFEGHDPSTWLPQVYEVFEILLKHLAVEPEGFLGKEHAGFAAKMLDDRRQSIESEVKERVAKAARDYGKLADAEKAERVSRAQTRVEKWASESALREVCECPACGNPAAIAGESLNRGPPNIDEQNGTITREVRVLPNAFQCVGCMLKLKGYQELLQVGLGKLFTSVEYEDPVEFFGIDPEEYVDMDDLLKRAYEDDMGGYQNE